MNRASDVLEAAEVRILRLQPGDEIVLKVNQRITRQTLMDLKQAAEDQWPGHKVTVLDNSVDLQVIRK